MIFLNDLFTYVISFHEKKIGIFHQIPLEIESVLRSMTFT